MEWVKRGLIYRPQGQYHWNKSHAQLPVVDATNEKIWRIYFSTRDEQNRSHGSYIEVEAGNPANVLYQHNQPILPLGQLGTFDDCGVMPSWILDVGDLKYLYYIGWTVRTTIPYHNSIGLAISRDGGRTFQRFAEGPLFSPTPTEPYFNGSSCVLREDNLWRNWYLSCTRWEVIDGKAEPFYHLKYAESRDGIHWERNGQVAIDYQSADEGGIVGASVIRENGIYRMWYSCRKGANYRKNPQNSYRIGYAESADGVNWDRMDEKAGIDISATGWDSEMIAYPRVISYQGTKYLFYNGNGFGRSGVGYATLEEDQ